MSLHHGLRSAAGASVADPYFANTSLLLLGNGTNGGQNNTFVDGSSNAFSVTRYGNTTQGTFSPFGYNWSNYFRGESAGDRLEIAHSTEITIGTQSFWMEAWVFPTRFYDEAMIAQRRQYYNVGTGTWIWFINSTGTLYFYDLQGPSLIIQTASGAIPLNTWTHIAVSRDSSNVWRMYVNGVSSGTTTPTNGFNFSTTNPMFIGYNSDNRNNSFDGYISNFRMGIGSALYSGSSSFTPPTSPLTAVTNTKVLTCQSHRFVDNSSNAFAISVTGSPSVTNFAPFPTNSEYSTGVNGGSGYFDGSGDYLSIAANSEIQFGTGDYTIDFWVYPLQSGRQDMIDMPGTNRLQVAYEGTNTAIYINQTFIAGSAVAPTVNAWNHIAATRSGTSTRVFLNGTQLGSTATNSTNFSDNSLKIVDTTSGTTPLKGYLAGLRVVKGGALYTASYTVPTAPPTTTVSSGTVGALLNFTNASVLDSTGKNDIETVGDAQISTSVKKYGTGSLKFDGTGDYLSIPDSSVFDLGSGDFTLETWVNFSALPSASDAWTFASQWRSVSPQSLGWFYYLYNNAGTYGIYLSYSTTGTNQINLSVNLASAPSTGTWYHYAICRSGSNLRFFVDGVQVGSTQTLSGTIFNSTAQVWIGAQDSGSAAYQLNGYLDDFRLTKFARYTAAFTPPSRQLPAR